MTSNRNKIAPTKTRVVARLCGWDGMRMGWDEDVVASPPLAFMIGRNKPQQAQGYLTF